MNRQDGLGGYPVEDPSQQDEPPMDDDVEYVDYSQNGYDDDEYGDENDELDGAHRFHVAMNLLDLISALAGLAVILVLTAILISLLTWLQSDISQSFTLLASQLQ